MRCKRADRFPQRFRSVLPSHTRGCGLRGGFAMVRGQGECAQRPPLVPFRAWRRSDGMRSVEVSQQERRLALRFPFLRRGHPGQDLNAADLRSAEPKRAHLRAFLPRVEHFPDRRARAVAMVHVLVPEAPRHDSVPEESWFLRSRVHRDVLLHNPLSSRRATHPPLAWARNLAAAPNLSAPSCPCSAPHRPTSLLHAYG
jgi:hypothetical protein